MKTFTTETGSTYEYDLINNRIRKSAGNTSTTTLRLRDGWKDFDSLSAVEIGKEVCIVWSKNVQLLEGSPKDSIPSTITSRVVSISSEEE